MILSRIARQAGIRMLTVATRLQRPGRSDHHQRQDHSADVGRGERKSGGSQDESQYRGAYTQQQRFGENQRQDVEVGKASVSDANSQVRSRTIHHRVAVRTSSVKNTAPQLPG